MINNIFIFFNLFFIIVWYYLLCFNILFLEFVVVFWICYFEKLKCVICEVKEVNYDGIFNF